MEIKRHAKLPISDVAPKQYFRVVKAGFSQKRKQLKNSLAGGLAVSQDEILAYMMQANIDPQRRAETLTLDEWAALARIIPS